MSIIILLIIIISPVLTSKKKDTVVPTSTKANTYEIFVDVDESKLYLISDKKIEKVYKCSGGKWSTPSPVGTWKITEKAKWGEGFGGSWMGLNVPWGKFRNTWNTTRKLIGMGKLAWLHKDGQ